MEMKPLMIKALIQGTWKLVELYDTCRNGAIVTFFDNRKQIIMYVEDGSWGLIW